MPLVGIRKRSNLTIASAFAILFALAALIAGCAGQPQTGTGTFDQPPGLFPVAPVTQAGEATSDLYDLTFAIAVIVFVLVEGLLIYITLRFRRRPSDTELPKQTHGSNPLEILWTVVPAITVTLLFIAALITLNNEAEASSTTPSVVVDVTGFQWQWTFEYRDKGLSFTGTGSTGPVMALPVNEQVRIRLHGVDTDVIHSFYVPQFLYKKDVVPGRVNEFDVVVTDPGTYHGQCAEFCGLSHADMNFSVQAMTRADFDAWVTEQQQAVPTPGPSAPPGAPTVQLTSVGILEGFNPSAITAPANTPWVVNLTNTDAGVPHDFAIRGAGPDGSDWQGDPDAPGGGSAIYQPPLLKPGDYQFYCSIHPNMVGTLKAQ